MRALGERMNENKEYDMDVSQLFIYCCDEMFKTTYKKIVFGWSITCRRIRVHDHHGREHGSKPVGMMLEQYLGAYI